MVGCVLLLIGIRQFAGEMVIIIHKMRITSRDNEKLKFARRVRDGKERDFIFAEGSRLCGETLASGINVEYCFVSDVFHGSGVFELPEHVDTFFVSESLLDSIADTRTPQGIVLIAKRPASAEISKVLSRYGEIPIWLYLYEINNPSNLGAVIRTAEAAGASGIFSSKRSADAFSPKSLRASMGSAFRLPIVEQCDFEITAECARENKIRLFAVDAKGNTSHTKADWSRPTLLIFGSEAKGLPHDLIDAADETIKVEMNGTVESLNLAVSCGVILFEARRRLSVAEARTK